MLQQMWIERSGKSVDERESDRRRELEQENRRLRRALEEVSILNEIAIAISSTLSLDHILDLIVKKSLRHIAAEQGAVLLLDEQKEERPFQTMIRGWDTSSENLPFRLDTQLTGWMLKHRRPLLSNDFAADDRFHKAAGESLPVASLLCVPLMAKGRMIGLISMFNKKSQDGFSEEDQRLLSIIATQSAQTIENARLLEEEQALIRMQEELRLACEIQTNLLPAAPPEIPGYDVYGRSIPAKEVGGDYFDFIPTGPCRLSFCLGDVSGKGMPAALLMSNLQATIRGQAMLHASIPDCLSHSNRLLFHNTSPEKFATLFYGCIDTKHHALSYANAGHNFPLLFRADGSHRTLEVGGMVLGCLDGSAFVEETVELAAGDRLVVYSDGITEAVNREDEEFGETRLIDLVRAHARSGSRELAETVLDAVQRHAGDAPQMDDMTLVIIRRDVT